MTKYELIGLDGRLELLTLAYNKRVIIKDGCWDWIGNSISNYTSLGISRSGRLSIYGHIFSWYLKNGRWPEKGKIICHTCNNRLCTNPDHLYEGTHKSNALDRYK